MMSKITKLLVADKINEEGLKPLRKYFQIEVRTGLTDEKLAEIIGDYEVIITRSSTALSERIIANASKLKTIARAGIGVDNIDIEAATARNIAVVNAPKGNARVTAEHTIGLMFSLMRHIPQANNELKEGIWAKSKYTGSQVFGKTLGIVGFGNVGKEVFRMANGLGMKVVVCEPYTKLSKNVSKMTFEELLKVSDAITFHVPLTYLTNSMLNLYTLKLCKKEVYIINCSRGGVVDEKAVFQALKQGQIAGLAIDVFTKEPPIDKRLLDLPNVIATPHIGGSTYESQKQSISEAVTAILQLKEGNVPSNLLNPQVFKKIRQRRLVGGFDTVIFDCDSTLSAIEGIDELAGLVGKKEAVAKLTRLAMEGKIKYVDAFEKRLALTKPKKQDLEKIGRLYMDNLLEDAKGVLEALKFLGKEIYIVSGSYTPALTFFGRNLGIPDRNIFGNDLLFDEKGNYRTFIGGPLRRNHGKLQVIRQITGRRIMVGDAVTDLESKEVVDLFIGFGGVVKREIVEKNSELFLYCRSFAPILVMAAGFEGSVELLKSKYRKYVGKGLDLLSSQKHVKAEGKLRRKLNDYKKLAYL